MQRMYGYGLRTTDMDYRHQNPLPIHTLRYVRRVIFSMHVVFYIRLLNFILYFYFLNYEYKPYITYNIHYFYINKNDFPAAVTFFSPLSPLLLTSFFIFYSHHIVQFVFHILHNQSTTKSVFYFR